MYRWCNTADPHREFKYICSYTWISLPEYKLAYSSSNNKYSFIIVRIFYWVFSPDCVNYCQIYFGYPSWSQLLSEFYCLSNFDYYCQFDFISLKNIEISRPCVHVHTCIRVFYICICVSVCVYVYIYTYKYIYNMKYFESDRS